MKIIQFFGILLMCCLFLNSSIEGSDSECANPKLSNQLIPRLIYSKKSGRQPDFENPVQKARHLLFKMGLERFHLQLMQAASTPDGLLFEMKAYEQAREIMEKWKSLYPSSKNFYKNFDLKQTERHFRD